MERLLDGEDDTFSKMFSPLGPRARPEGAPTSSPTAASRASASAYLRFRRKGDYVSEYGTL
jgi:hypothetical protein